MITALMVKRMPQTTAHMLSGSAVEHIVTGKGVGRGSIMLRLDQHGVFAPVAGHTAWRIMRVPVIHIVTPLTCEVCDIGIHVRHGPLLVGIGRMTKLHGIYFMPTGFTVATRVAVRIRILLTDDVLCPFGKVGRIPCFVQDRFPQPHARMVAVTTYHLTDIIIYTFGKDGSLVPELPPRCVDDDKQAEFVTGIHKGGILRAMGIADNLESGITQLLGITPMKSIRDCISHNGIVLMTIGTDEGLAIGFPVQPESVFPLELDAADTDAATVAIHHIALLVADAYNEVIEVGMLRTPELWCLEFHLITCSKRLSRAYLHLSVYQSRLPPVGLLQFVFDDTTEILSAIIAHLSLHKNCGRGFRHVVIGNKQTATSRFVFEIGVGDIHITMGNEPAVAVYTSEVTEIKHFLSLAWGIGRVIAVVCPYGYEILLVPLNGFCDIQHNGQIASIVLGQQLAIHIDLAFSHDSLKMQKQFLPFQLFVGSKMLAVPRFTLIVDTTTGFCGQIFQSVRQGYHLPTAVIESDRLGSLGASFIEPPGRIHRMYRSARLRQFIETSRRELGVAVCRGRLEQQESQRQQ